MFNDTKVDLELGGIKPSLPKLHLLMMSSLPRESDEMILKPESTLWSLKKFSLNLMKMQDVRDWSKFNINNCFVSKIFNDWAMLFIIMLVTAQNSNINFFKLQKCVPFNVSSISSSFEDALFFLFSVYVLSLLIVCFVIYSGHFGESCWITHLFLIFCKMLNPFFHMILFSSFLNNWSFLKKCSNNFHQAEDLQVFEMDKTSTVQLLGNLLSVHGCFHHIQCHKFVV